MLAAGLEAVNQSIEAIIIILLVSCLIGSFTACGTIPASYFMPGLDCNSQKALTGPGDFAILKRKRIFRARCNSSPVVIVHESQD